MPLDHNGIRQAPGGETLIFVNVFVIVLDVSLLVTQYTGNFQIQTTYKPVVYSIKLKMEFVILNRLLRLVQRSGYEHWFVLDSSGAPPGTSEGQSGAFDRDHEVRASVAHGIELQEIPRPGASDPAAVKNGPLRRIQTTPAALAGVAS